MSRILVFVALLLATGAVLADDVPEGARAPAATEAKAPSATRTTEVQAPTEAGATEAKAKTEDGAKFIDGMSVLGNREAPKSLVIVPWKSSEIGDTLGISTMLDDSRQPIDREVFMRALRYYEIQHGGRGGAADVDEKAVD
jgi:hypothetical protein